MTVILAAQEMGSRRIAAGDQPRLKVEKTSYHPMAGLHDTHLLSQLFGEAQVGRSCPYLPGNKVRPYLKITNAKRARGVPQAVECLPSKHKALISNPSTAFPE
jgi:hypothetical protein